MLTCVSSSITIRVYLVSIHCVVLVQWDLYLWLKLLRCFFIESKIIDNMTMWPKFAQRNKMIQFGVTLWKLTCKSLNHSNSWEELLKSGNSRWKGPGVESNGSSASKSKPHPAMQDNYQICTNVSLLDYGFYICLTRAAQLQVSVISSVDQHFCSAKDEINFSNLYIWKLYVIRVAY